MKKLLATLSLSALLVACGETQVTEKPKSDSVVDESNKVENIDNLVVKTSKYKPGEHYTILKTPIESKNNEIIEYFWYKCPHCYSFEQMLKHNYQMLIKDEITIRVEHAAIAKHWVQDAQLFYTFREMGLEKKATGILMDFFHNNKDKKKTFDGALKEIGVTQEELNKVFTSEPVINALKKSYEDAVKAGITGTPSIIVEGKYLMNSKVFKDYKDLLQAAIEVAKIDDSKSETEK